MSAVDVIIEATSRARVRKADWLRVVPEMPVPTRKLHLEASHHCRSVNKRRMA